MERTTLPFGESEASQAQHSVQDEASLIRSITAGDGGRFLDLRRTEVLSCEAVLGKTIGGGS